MNLLTKTSLVIAASLALLTPAGAAQPAMVRAKELAVNALTALQENATSDKGGHRVAAIKKLQAAIDEIEAGIAFDRTTATPGEGGKGKGKGKKN